MIEPESELRVSYSLEYAKHVGMETRLKDLKFNKGMEVLPLWAILKGFTL